MTQPIQPAPEPLPPPKTSGLAIAALVMSFVPVCLNYIGIVLGIIAAVQISKDRANKKGMGLAIASIVIGSAWVPISIIAAIAIPNFLMFQSRSKQSEAKANLKMLYVSQEAYRAETGEYGRDFAAIGFTPEANRRYSYHFGGVVVPADAEEPVALPPDVETGLFEGGGFQAAAVGNIDGDPDVDVWVIDENGQPFQMYDDL